MTKKGAAPRRAKNETEPASTAHARLELMPLSELMKLEWERNPKEHDIVGLRGSMRRFGFTIPLVLDERTGRIVAGHGRLHALAAEHAEGNPPPRLIVEAEGDWLVPVLRGIEFSSVAEAEAYLVADNRLSEIGGWNETKLGAILADLSREGIASGLGWSDRELATLIAAEQPLVIGKNLDEAFEDYLEADVKQLVLFFDAATYDNVVPRMKLLMEKLNAKSHTDLFTLMLAIAEEKVGA